MHMHAAHHPAPDAACLLHVRLHGHARVPYACSAWCAPALLKNNSCMPSRRLQPRRPRSWRNWCGEGGWVINIKRLLIMFVGLRGRERSRYSCRPCVEHARPPQPSPRVHDVCASASSCPGPGQVATSFGAQQRKLADKFKTIEAVNAKYQAVRCCWPGSSWGGEGRVVAAQPAHHSITVCLHQAVDSRATACSR